MGSATLRLLRTVFEVRSFNRISEPRGGRVLIRSLSWYLVYLTSFPHLFRGMVRPHLWRSRAVSERAGGH